MQPTKISWATYTWNPQTGCSRAGPICAERVEVDGETEVIPKCYAERLSREEGRTEKPWKVENADENVTMHENRVDDPDNYHWPKGHGRTFVGSMTDMFHAQTDPGFVQNILDACRRHPKEMFIFLTKRPHHAAEWRLDWPENCMLGTSVGSAGNEYPSTLHRIEQLRDVDVKMKWVSFEPLLEPIGDVALDHIDWVVVGGESGPDRHRREMKDEWARNILQQCRDAGIPFFYKQGSARYPETDTKLLVENEEFGIYEKREIREFPEWPEEVTSARE